MSYRGGGEYGHGGYHQDMPVAQLGDMNIDPDEFPKVAQHLQSLHISHQGSSSGSTGYPEDGTRYLHIDPTGAHYYTDEPPTSIATYSGYGYIQAPEPSSAAPHAFAGAIRTPVNASFSHGMGYFDASWPPPPPHNIPFPLNTPYTSPAQSKRYSTMTTPSTPTTYGRPFTALGNGTPQSTTSAYPPPTPLSLPPPSPAVSSSTSSSTKPSAFPPTRRFSYDDGGHSSQYLNNVSKKYQDFMQSFSNGIEGRDRYEPSHDSYDEPRGRRQTYYRPSGEGYITPGANIPRTSTKTPGPGGEIAALRRGTIAAIHQPRPPNSRHSSSESGDAEPTYPPGPRYDSEYNGNARPKGKSRPNSFSYPRPTDSEPNFSARYSFVPESPFDPRSSTGSLGNPGSRYNPSPVVLQPGGGYYKQYEPSSGPVTVNTGGWGKGPSYNYVPQPSRPLDYGYYPTPDDRERTDFDSRRRRDQSKTRFRARTPGPEDRASASEDDRYRASMAKSRPSSPSSSQQRAKSRRRRGSQSPVPYRAKSRMRSKSRPRPEIVQPTRPLPGETPARPSTPGSARPKTPMPGSSAGIDTESMIRMEAERQERENARQEMEREKTRQEMEREKSRQEKARQEKARQEKARQEERAIQEIYESMERVTSEQEGSQTRNSDKENYNYPGHHHHHHHERHKSRARSRPRDHHSRSTSNERSERESSKEERREERRKERERQRDSEQERERENERNKDKERERERERREKVREETLAKLKSEQAPKVTDPALANPMVENLNPPGRNRERAGVQPGQTFIRPDLLCAMKALKLCVVEHDPHDDHAHNQLLRLDCGHGYHEDCLRSAVSSRERIPQAQVDLEAEKLWCERCRGTFGKKAGR
ncbi:hypothetical protein TWF281_001477 [Arthrobotrys megalospora]